MQVIEKKRAIPARTILEKVWIAFDGTEFDSCDSCLDYERNLQLKNTNVYKQRIENIPNFCGGYPVTLFFIQSQDDWETVMLIKSVHRLSSASDTFERCGPGWYMHYWAADGSVHGIDHINSLSKYMSDLEERWAQWKQNLFKKIGCVTDPNEAGQKEQA